jgi:hypothetical protein
VFSRSDLEWHGLPLQRLASLGQARLPDRQQSRFSRWVYQFIARTPATIDKQLILIEMILAPLVRFCVLLTKRTAIIACSSVDWSAPRSFCARTQHAHAGLSTEYACFIAVHIC